MIAKSLLGCLLALALAGCAAAPDPYVEGSTSYVRHLAPEQYDVWRGIHYDALLLDVRTGAEWDDDLSHLDGAMNIPIEELGSRLPELEQWKKKSVVVYDRMGTNTTRAGQILVTSGFQDVSVIDGGLMAYRQWQKSR
jgi:rhodanese-related sulfurtransferase